MYITTMMTAIPTKPAIRVARMSSATLSDTAASILLTASKTSSTSIDETTKNSGKYSGSYSAGGTGIGNADSILPCVRRRFSSKLRRTSIGSHGFVKSTRDLNCSNVASSRPRLRSASSTEIVEDADVESHRGDATTVPSSSHLNNATSVVSPNEISSMISPICSTLTSASVHAMNSPVSRSYTARPIVISQRPSLNASRYGPTFCALFGFIACF
mmetsp:Transcript_27904/g.56471  ORF Transcript_27904/g.56471 Transcript_27904/m.56471 type:complete len:215 (+) Transcript_27904:12540-13184(+)